MHFIELQLTSHNVVHIGGSPAGVGKLSTSLWLTGLVCTCMKCGFISYQPSVSEGGSQNLYYV